MYIGIQTIQILIGVVVLLAVAMLIIPKQYYTSKSRGCILLRTTNQAGDETTELVKVLGESTAPNRKNRSYIPIAKHWDDKKKEFIGNISSGKYPEGLPSFWQVPIKVLNTSEGNPAGSNLYGKQEIQITDFEIGTIHKEAFSQAAIAASSDARDLLKELKGQIKPLNKTLIYIGLAVILIGVLAAAYFGFQNNQAINNLKWW